MKDKKGNFNIKVEHVEPEEADGDYVEMLKGKKHHKKIETRISPVDGVEETEVTYDPMRGKKNQFKIPPDRWEDIFGKGKERNESRKRNI